MVKKNFSFSWVLVDELMVGSAPTLEAHLTALESEGIKSILTLCSNKEVDIPEREKAKKLNYNFLMYPDFIANNQKTFKIWN